MLDVDVSVAIPDDCGLPVRNADLGSAIRGLRRARRLTIDDLAWGAGMHTTYLSGIERGRRNPTWRKLADIARALKVPVSVIVLTAEEHRKKEAVYVGVAEALRAAPPVRLRLPP
jgi:transcriptional regulator with XRE-family HTH domain